MKIKTLFFATLTVWTASCNFSHDEATLPSWNETPVKAQLMKFLQQQVDSIPVSDRIAVFDMDGTLVCEKPWGIETVVSLHRLVEQGESRRNTKKILSATARRSSAI